MVQSPHLTSDAVPVRALSKISVRTFNTGFVCCVPPPLRRCKHIFRDTSTSQRATHSCTLINSQKSGPKHCPVLYGQFMFVALNWIAEPEMNEMGERKKNEFAVIWKPRCRFVLLLRGFCATSHHYLSDDSFAAFNLEMFRQEFEIVWCYLWVCVCRTIGRLDHVFIEILLPLTENWYFFFGTGWISAMDI